MRGALRGLPGWGVTVALANAACRGPTEVTLDLSTDIACPSLYGTTVTVGALGELERKAPVATSTSCAPGGALGDLVVVPSHGLDTVAVRVVAGVGRDPASCVAPAYGPGCIVARRAIRFLAHSPLRISIPLRSTCEGVVCAEDETCVDGMCVSAVIDDPNKCKSGCDETALGTVVPDAGAPDSGDAGDGSDAADGGNDGGGGSADGGGPELTRTTLAVGYSHSCAFKGPDLFCWGANSDGQLGSANPADQPTPTPVHVDNIGFVEVAAGAYHTCARTATGDVYCWGRGSSGQLGSGTTQSEPTLTAVLLPAPAIELKASYFQTCVRLVDGRVACTGFNGYGALANATKEPNLSFTPMIGVDHAAEIAIGDQTLCVRRVDGSVQCSGSDHADSCADEKGIDATTAVRANVPPAVALSAAGGWFTLLAMNRSIHTWGRASIDSPARADTPVTAFPRAPAALGYGTPGCIIDETATIQCVRDADLSLTTPPGITQAAAMASNGSNAHFCAVRTTTTGKIVCFGTNTHGELGDGTMMTRTAPVAVVGF
jgi:alpha-tubulin suppressor-like RCC1 family protein